MSDFLGKYRPSVTFVSGIVASCTAGLAIYGLYYIITTRRYKTRVWREVGNITQIFVHPVKACRGIELTEAECTGLGMISLQGIPDRQYLILNDENRVVTMRQNRKLALIRTSQSDDLQDIQLDAPDMPTIKIPLHETFTNDVTKFRLWGIDVEGYDCGDEQAQWLHTYLDTPHRLVCYTNALKPRSNKEYECRATANDKSVYQDSSQYHLFTEASLEDLNSKLENKVGIRNFRPNFVVSGPAPYEEDNWKFVKVGENVILRTTQLCGRCSQITVDPETGMKSEDPLKTLRSLRTVGPTHPDHKLLDKAPAFGIYLNMDNEGTIAVGDTVYASI